MSQTATQYFHEANRLDWLVPQSATNIEKFAGWGSMRDYHKAVAIVLVGSMAANSLLNAKLIQATDTVGTGAKDITGKAVTTLTDADDNKVVMIELDGSEMDVANGYDCVALQVNTGGNAAVLVAAVLVRFQPRFSEVDSSNIEEIVV